MKNWVNSSHSEMLLRNSCAKKYIQRKIVHLNQIGTSKMPFEFFFIFRQKSEFERTTIQG